MSPILVLGTSIRTREERQYLSLNDLHNASQEGNHKRPSKWLVTQNAKDLISELKSESPNSGFEPLRILRGGKNGGTYACKELFLAYAMWLKAKVHLAAIRALEEKITSTTEQGTSKPDPELLSIHHSAVDQTGACIVTRNHWGGTTATPISPESLDLITAAHAFINQTKQAGYLVIKPEDVLKKLGGA